MTISITYLRPHPDTLMGHRIVLTQVYYSMDKREIDMVEDLFKAQYGSGVVSEVSIPREGIDD